MDRIALARKKFTRHSLIIAASLLFILSLLEMYFLGGDHSPAIFGLLAGVMFLMAIPVADSVDPGYRGSIFTVLVGASFAAYRLWTINGSITLIALTFAVLPLSALLFGSRNELVKSGLFALVFCAATLFFVFNFPYWSVSHSYPIPLSRGLAMLSIFTIIFYLSQLYIVLNILKSELSKQHTMLMFDSLHSEVGQMAGNIAHEVNTPLSALMFMNQELKNAFRDRESVYVDELFEKQERIIEKISMNIGAVLRCTRPNYDLVSETFLPSAVIEDVQLLLSHKIDLKKIKLCFHSLIEKSQTYYLTDTHVITQTLIILLNNAIDALERLPDVAEKKIDVQFFDSHSEFIIECMDNGGGIDPAIQEKILKRNVTTKKESGSGIGLVVARNLMSTIRGKIEYISTPGHTLFRLSFPKVLGKEIPISMVEGS